MVFDVNFCGNRLLSRRRYSRWPGRTTRRLCRQAVEDSRNISLAASASLRALALKDRR